MRLNLPNLEELQVRLRAGAMKVEFFGHRGPRLTAEILQAQLAEALGEGEPLRTLVGNQPLERNLVLGSSLSLFCEACGVALYLVLLDGETLGLMENAAYARQMAAGTEALRDACCANEPEPELRLHWPSGRVLLAGAFAHLSDAPEGQEDSREYNLCQLRGRRNVQKHLADQGAAMALSERLDVVVYVGRNDRTIALVPAGHSRTELRSRINAANPRQSALAARQLGELDDLEKSHRCAGRINLESGRWVALDRSSLPPEFVENPNESYLDCSLQGGIYTLEDRRAHPASIIAFTLKRLD